MRKGDRLGGNGKDGYRVALPVLNSKQSQHLGKSHFIAKKS